MNLSVPASAAPVRNVPQTLVQPEGEILECFASGDEYRNWLHDKDGYIIVQEKATGYYVYAKEANGGMAPTEYIAGLDNPRHTSLRRYTRLSAAPPPEAGRAEDASLQTAAPLMGFGFMPARGTVNSIVIFIRFNDEAEFTDPISFFDGMFNSAGSGPASEALGQVAEGEAGSVRNYFTEVSGGQLTVSSTFYPTSQTGTVLSYRDIYNRSRYKPYNSATNPDGYVNSIDGKQRLDAMLKRAVDAISGQVPAELTLDVNGYGDVDSVVFIVSGTSTGWSSILWPTSWAMIYERPYINGKRVYAYNLQLRDWLVGSPPNVGVACHEMCHSIGMPDLYHYSGSGVEPVGPWDVMEDTTRVPQGMNAHLRYRYAGWFESIPEIVSDGRYTLDPLSSATGNRCYKIRSPNSTTEYFLVEYRRKVGTFEASVPDSGMLVYRINSAKDGQGNANGPPDEIYVYRPGGTATANGTIRSANFSSGVGRTAINDSTNPSSFLSNGASGRLGISNVSAAGSTISFDVTHVPSPPAEPPGILLSASSVTVPEGGTATFDVKLDQQPATNTIVSVSFLSGDTDIRVASGASLTFTLANWSTYQPVTLAAAEDDDTVNGTATVRCAAGPASEAGCATATEAENDQPRSIITSPNDVTVPEASTATFDVKLDQQPASDVVVTVAHLSGDTDITVVSGESLTFTPANWSICQTVTLAAVEDEDATNGVATIRCTADGQTLKDVTATEADDERLLAVQTTPVSGVSITGIPEGVSEYSDVLAAGAPVTLTAPESVSVSGQTYEFRKWVLGGVAQSGGNEAAFTLDQNTTAVAVYARPCTLTVETTPISGVSIAGPASGGGGRSCFSQVLDSGAKVRINAPDVVVVSGRAYSLYRWVIDGSAKTAYKGQATFTIRKDMGAVAVYRRVRQVRVYGPSRIFENDGANYTCWAVFTSGPCRDVTRLATWQEETHFLNFDAPGRLRAYSVPWTLSRRFTVSYGGVVKRIGVTIVAR